MGDLNTQIFGDVLVKLQPRVWDETRMYWPHKNIFTGKRMLPFTKAMRGRADTEYGPVSVLYMEYIAYWARSDELLMYKLKGNA